MSHIMNNCIWFLKSLNLLWVLQCHEPLAQFHISLHTIDLVRRAQTLRASTVCHSWSFQNKSKLGPSIFLGTCKPWNTNFEIPCSYLMRYWNIKSNPTPKFVFVSRLCCSHPVFKFWIPRSKHNLKHIW